MAEVDDLLADIFEVDVSNALKACTLQKSCCSKNKQQHSEFIPINDFTSSHLPLGYQDEDILEVIKRSADLIVQLTALTVSPSRPEFFPESPSRPEFFSKSKMHYPFYNKIGTYGQRRYGTGRIVNVMKQEDKPCPCEECQVSGRVTKEWGEIWVLTAAHVVFDDFEARQTTCGLFFDLPVGPRKIVKGGWADDNLSVLKGDWSIFKYASCDLELVDLLQNMIDYCQEQCEKVRRKYHSTQDADKLAVIVSHPHGCSAHVTVGHWIDRSVNLEAQPENSGEVCLGTSYTYTTSTCPGSSGAYVYKLGRGGWAPLHLHFGVFNGINFSGEALEFKESQ